MFRLEKTSDVHLKSDIYVSRVRPGQPQVLFNDSYDGVRSLDCLDATLSEIIAFPEPDFSIYTWLVSPDGSRAYLFSPDQMEYAVELDLVLQKSRKVRLGEGFRPPTELCWFASTPYVLDYHDMVWTLKGDGFVKAGAEEADRLYTRDYRRITKRFVVKKMHWQEPGVYVRSREYPNKQVGYIPMTDGPSLLVDFDDNVIDVTHHRESLFTASDQEIVQHHRGKVRPVLAAEEGTSFLGLNVVEAAQWVFLCVLSATHDYSESPDAALTLYRIV